MDKSAIQQIQESANIPEIISHVKNFDTAIPIAVTPNNMTVHDLEQFMPNASFYRMSYNTSNINDFINYCKVYSSENTICFISDNGMSAVSIFDLGTTEAPGHKKHKATLNLNSTAKYTSLLCAADTRLAQKAACEFMEDSSDYLTAFKSNGEEIPIKIAIHFLRNLTIESAREVNSRVEDFSETMSSMERIEAKNKDSLPASLKFRCEPYLGLAERSFKVRVRVLTGSDKPTISLNIIKYEKIVEEMTEEFKSILKDSFDSEIKTYIGEV